MKLAQILRERTAKPAAEWVNFVRFINADYHSFLNNFHYANSLNHG